jgi:hypothetical protein
VSPPHHLAYRDPLFARGNHRGPGPHQSINVDGIISGSLLHFTDLLGVRLPFLWVIAKKFSRRFTLVTVTLYPGTPSNLFYDPLNHNASFSFLSCLVHTRKFFSPAGQGT